MKPEFFLLVLVLLAFGCADNTAWEKDFPVRSVVVNGTEYKYRIYIPANRDPAQEIPVMLFLHGSGARSDDNQSQAAGFRDLVSEYRDRYSFAIVLPQCRPGTFWAGEMTEQAMAALEQTVKEVNGDESRLYLAGYSMGGYGTWQTAVTYPGKFAALVPIAGGIVPNGPVSEEDKAILSPRVRAAADSADPYDSFADAIGNTPVWIFHGAADDIVLAEGSRKMAEVLKARGNTNVNYTAFAGVGHGSLMKALTEPALYEWLAQQRLPANERAGPTGAVCDNFLKALFQGGFLHGRGKCGRPGRDS
jgi:predicted peptidase